MRRLQTQTHRVPLLKRRCPTVYEQSIYKTFCLDADIVNHAIWRKNSEVKYQRICG